MSLIPMLWCIGALFSIAVASSCDAPSPAYMLPSFDRHDPELRALSRQVITSLQQLPLQSKDNASSFSIEVTSQQETLLSLQHSAKVRSIYFDGGADPVNDDTRYRIASMTKPFVVLAILKLQKAGHLSLDDPVLKHLTELGGEEYAGMPWKDTTLRALMTQQPGIPRDFAQDDFINDPEASARLGFPSLDRQKLDLPTCDEMVNYTRSCNSTDFHHNLKSLQPLFAPNQHPSYSNIAFNLLGLVIAKVSNETFESYITDDILQPLGMNQTGFTTPPNSVAAIAPGGAELYWPFDMGIQNAAGGLYSTSHDMSIWLRYVLSTYNGQTPALNWFNPTSFSGSSQTFYGTPWEIYRGQLKDMVSENDQSKLNSTRPLTFIAKGGGLPGYSSVTITMPDYALGVTILVVGDSDILGRIRDIIIPPLVSYAERLCLADLESTYIGTYSDLSTNSTLTISSSPSAGLHISAAILNGVDSFGALTRQLAGNRAHTHVTLHVVPTMLYINETSQEGERWRVIPSVQTDIKSVFDNWCISDWDAKMYGGVPWNDVVFWKDDKRVSRVSLRGFRVELEREGQKRVGVGQEIEYANTLESGLLRVQE